MEPTTTKCRELICCYACLKEVYDMSALDLCLSVPQIPLLTAVLMLLIYKVLTSINKPLWCCWDMLLSPISIRGCWESLVIFWSHCGLWTKLCIEHGAVNSQPRKGQQLGSLAVLGPTLPSLTLPECFPDFHPDTEASRIICWIRLQHKIQPVCRSEKWPVKGRNLRVNCVSVLALSLAGYYRQSVKIPLIWA